LMETGVVMVGITILGTIGALSSSLVMRTGDRLTPWTDEVRE
jgi:ABC-type nitrate/sulfonate/bicarbonate transport system permease component